MSETLAELIEEYGLEEVIRRFHVAYKVRKQEDDTEECPVCGGSGVFDNERCEHCGGFGYLEDDDGKD